MTGLSAVSLMLGAFLTGAVLMGAVGVPLAGRRGYARGLEARQLIDWSAELRETADTAELPRQYGTLAEHHRRTRLPIGYGEVTDGGIVEDRVSEYELRSVRAVIDLARPEEDFGPGAVEPPDGPSPQSDRWPLTWWVVWLVLLPVHYLVGWRYFWDTTPGQRLDRAAVRLGRRERRWWIDRDHAPHSALAQAPGQLTVGEILARLAAAGEGVELAGHNVEPVRELVGVAGWAS